MVTAKVSTTDTYGLAPLQVRERAVMDTVLIWLPHRKCIVKILIDRKYYVKHLNKNIFSGSSSTTNEPNFKIVCNCIHELLNVLEDSAQREHTIECVDLNILCLCKSVQEYIF